jgi:hypothetical protein
MNYNNYEGETSPDVTLPTLYNTLQPLRRQFTAQLPQMIFEELSFF